MNHLPLDNGSVASADMLEGVLGRITFHAPDTGWTVARLQVAGSREPVPVVGTMLSPEAGESVRLFGAWTQHPQFGRQFRFERYQLIRPTTVAAIAAYLQGGLVHGIGPVLAKALVKHFGDRTLEVLDREPERLREVPGIGEGRAQALQDAWARHQGVHQIMIFLHEHGVGPSLAGRIYGRFGDRAIEMLEREPYALAREIWGVGFATADRIARSVGIGPDDPSRLEAGLLHLLNAATDDGHLYLPREMLLERGRELLDCGEQVLELALERLEYEGEVTSEPCGAEVAVYARRLYEVEQEVAGRLRALAEYRAPGVPPMAELRRWLDLREGFGEMALSDEQVCAVDGALRHGLSIITGGPGTGKTTVTRAIVDACRSLGKPVLLASPTGRAAKRLEQVAGQEASTVHRLLAYDPSRSGFRHGPDDPLPRSLLILDEASMLDIVLARYLLRAVPKGGQVVFIGDADQLPPVGPGDLLRDLVNSDVAPVYRLTEIFRQAAGSDIVRSAHLLNRGESPRFVKHKDWLKERGDCVWLEEEEVEGAVARVVKTATESLPKMGFGTGDIQVITPLRRGPLGVAALNELLQAALNPPASSKAETRRGETTFRTADRVLQQVNNYDRGVFNGDLGTITKVDLDARSLIVEYLLGTVQYPFSDLDELELAYAMTVHKSQGSEYPAVVIVVHSSHYIMLHRNLLYTALTRAKRMACIVGNNRGIWRAIRNVTQRDRFTRLGKRLAGELPAEVPMRRPVEEP
jgi:exodeoxyribonuclease V alpha subunit